MKLRRLKGFTARQQKELEERFWSNVERGSVFSCWRWKGNKDKDGYGKFWVPKKSDRRIQWRAHRLAFLFCNEAIDTRLRILHSCDNPPCCNPFHLSQGTDLENQRDAALKGRKARGIKHPFAKLENSSVRTIRRAYISGKTQMELAMVYHVSQSAISRVLRSETWAHI